MAGDNGFDPLCLTAMARPTLLPDALISMVTEPATKRNERFLALSKEEQAEALAWMRQSEVKHARLAMLAAAGWPLAELNNAAFLRDELGTNGRAPSLFNGGLFDGAAFPFVLLALGGTAASEFINLDNSKGLTKTDWGFDPLGWANNDGPDLVKKVGGPRMGAGQAELELCEIKNGRLAMMAITGYAVQEFLYGTPVVEQSYWFFHGP